MALRKRFLQTKLFWASIICGALLLFFLFQPRFLVDPFRVVFGTITAPVQHLFSFVGFEIRDSFGFFDSIGELKDENERLEKENIRLSANNARLLEIEKENEELRRSLELLPRKDYELVSAEVIGRDVSGVGNWITIDQGSAQGIQKGMSVIVEAGVLVGTVEDVFPSSARVMLLTNPESVVNGIANETGALGIIQGEHGLGLVYDMVRQTDTLKPSDTIVTSGLGGNIPKGLLVGTLQEPRYSEDRLFQKASIVSPVRTEKLRYIFVIKKIIEP